MAAVRSSLAALRILLAASSRPLALTLPRPTPPMRFLLPSSTFRFDLSRSLARGFASSNNDCGGTLDDGDDIDEDSDDELGGLDRDLDDLDDLDDLGGDFQDIDPCDDKDY